MCFHSSLVCHNDTKSYLWPFFTSWFYSGLFHLWCCVFNCKLHVYFLLHNALAGLWNSTMAEQRIILYQQNVYMGCMQKVSCHQDETSKTTTTTKPPTFSNSCLLTASYTLSHHLEMFVETQRQPVCQQLLHYRLWSPQHQLGVFPCHWLSYQVHQQHLQDAAQRQWCQDKNAGITTTNDNDCHGYL